MRCSLVRLPEHDTAWNGPSAGGHNDRQVHWRTAMNRSTRPPEALAPSADLRVGFDDFVLDEADARLSRSGREVALPPKALGVLCTLVRHAGRLVTKDALLDAVWGHRHVTESVLKSTISQVRSALGDDVHSPRYIETAARRGYRFIAATTPLPTDGAPAATPAPAAPDAAPLVGRDDAIAALDGLWTGCAGGRPRLVWIAGEAGVGKTALVDHWLHRSDPRWIAYGHCVEPFGASEPYLPILEALAALCRPDPRLAERLRRYAPTWAVQLPWLPAPEDGGALRAQLAGASQDRMLRELCDWLDLVTRERPLLLVLEDLHWSDASTVRLLQHLARRHSDARLMVLGTFRPTELVATDHPLKRLRHELRAGGTCEEIALDPLSERDVAELLRRCWRGDGDDALAAAMHAHTDGLPVFLVNVIDDLKSRSRGRLPDTQSCIQMLAMRVPENLSGMIWNQLGRLDHGQQALLRAASVRGQAFTDRCVAAILASTDDEARDRLGTLARTTPWIEETGIERQPDGRLGASFRFRHALYGQAIYGECGAAERTDAHLRLARDLALRSGAGVSVAPAELAFHFERGQSFEEALHWESVAAASALARFAPQEAAEHADRGLRLLERLPVMEDSPQRELALRVTRGVAVAQRHGVGSAAALSDLERARTLSNALPHGAQHTWLMNALGWTYFSRGDFLPAAEQGAAMHRLAGQHGDSLLALCAANLLGATHAYSGHLDDAAEWLDRALVALVDVGSDAATIRSIVDLETSIRVYRAQVLAHRGDNGAASVEADLALDRARRLGQPMSLCLALRCRALLAIRRDDLDGATAAAEELWTNVAEFGVAQSAGPARWYRGWTLARSGAHADGLEVVSEGLTNHLQLGMATGCALAYGYAAQICLWRADEAGARQALEFGLSLAERHAETIDRPFLLRLLAQVEETAGNARAAESARQMALSAAAAIGAA